MPTLDEKIRDFKNDLETIDLRNVDYFLFERLEQRKGVRDCLANHWKFKMQGEKPVFGFILGSPFPPRIWKQCFAKLGYYFADEAVFWRIFGR